jgi:phosphonate transport system permease protein
MSKALPNNDHRNPVLAGLLSTLIPGLGHIYLRKTYRGGAIFLAVLVILGIVAWYGKPIWYVAPVGMWLWNIWDAIKLAHHRTGSIIIPVLLGLVVAYGIGWQVVQIDFHSASLSRALQVAQPMLHPDFLETRSEKNETWVTITVPCPPTPPPPVHPAPGFDTSAVPTCASVGEAIIVTANGLWPNTDTQIWWQTHIGDAKMLGGNEDAMLVLPTDSVGTVRTIIHVPSTATTASPDPTLPLEHRVYFDQYHPINGIKISEVGNYVIQGMGETVALALMATTLAIFLALPLSFLAARNLMGGNLVTLAIYVIVRTFLNILRSIESLIVAIVFVIILGLGPFAGMMALTVHSVAALAKLYSEMIEGIDPGPIEAIRATGGNWAQVVRYGVIPQIIPPFVSFTLYRWDINVRTSTIIGMVGGGGIGMFLIQWIQLNDLRAVSTTFIAIAVVVITLDFLSAKVRARLV